MSSRTDQSLPRAQNWKKDLFSVRYKEIMMKKMATVGMVVLCLIAARSGSAAVVEVGDTNVTYGHNYLDSGNPRPFGDDCFYRSGGFFSDNFWYLHPGVSEYMIYRLQADPGYIISKIDLKVQTYLEASSWLAVLYRTTDYDGPPNFNEWTNLCYSYGGFNTYWPVTFNPNSNVVYLVQPFANKGANHAAWGFGALAIILATDLLVQLNG